MCKKCKASSSTCDNSPPSPTKVLWRSSAAAGSIQFSFHNKSSSSPIFPLLSPPFPRFPNSPAVFLPANPNPRAGGGGQPRHSQLLPPLDSLAGPGRMRPFLPYFLSFPCPAVHFLSQRHQFCWEAADSLARGPPLLAAAVALPGAVTQVQGGGPKSIHKSPSILLRLTHTYFLFFSFCWMGWVWQWVERGWEMGMG